MTISQPKHSATMAGCTHVGQRRESNQDNYLVADMRRLVDVCDSSLIDLDGRKIVGTPPGELLIVADGMGGYAHGDRASQVAVQLTAEYVSGLMKDFLIIDPDDDEEFRNALLRAPETIHQQLMAEAQGSIDKRQMGTTLTVAYVAWPWCYVLHVGDTQAFLVRDQKIRKITRDQTLAQSLLETGLPDSEIPMRFWHTLESCISASPDHPHPQLYRLELQVGDSLVLNSDGLTRHVEVDEISSVVLGEGTVQEKCETLVAKANDNGGRDNITVVLADFSATPDSGQMCNNSEIYSVVPSLADTAIQEG